MRTNQTFETMVAAMAVHMPPKKPLVHLLRRSHDPRGRCDGLVPDVVWHGPMSS
jgi:hypothetical protein